MITLLYKKKKKTVLCFLSTQIIVKYVVLQQQMEK